MNDSTNMTMPVQPMYGGNGGFGGWGSDIWLILIVLFAFGGWGNGFGGGFGGGYGNMMLGYDFPWLLNGQSAINANTNNGFQNALLNDNITSIRDGVSALSTQLCGCCGDMQMALSNGFANAETAANARQIANMQTAFNAQTAMNSGFNSVQSQLAQCCCDNKAGIADLKYTVATENCADRTAAYQNTRDIIDASNRNSQAILDKLCQLELDNVKTQLDAKNDRIGELQTQLNMATLRESQTAQNAFIAQGLNNEVDALYNRLSNCPVPSTPVYGRTPIFTCNQNQGCGCGCGNF